MDSPHMFSLGRVDSNSNLPSKLSIDSSCEDYERLLHYSNLQTLETILSHMTLQLSSLNYIKLNDKFEKQLKGIEVYAKDCFVSCFSHCPYEIVPFWYNYGGHEIKEKILLVFKNFSRRLNDCVHTDFFLTCDGKKMYFDLDDNVDDDNPKTGNFSVELPGVGHLSFSGRMREAKSSPEFDSRSYVLSLQVKDVEYLPIKHPVFEKVYMQETDVLFPGADKPIRIPEFDINPFALYKTNHWDYEKETRIICRLATSEKIQFDRIYLRLKDDFFSELIIVENPWANDDLAKQIQNIIDNSPLSSSVKSSVRIVKSELDGLLL